MLLGEFTEIKEGDEVRRSGTDHDSFPAWFISCMVRIRHGSYPCMVRIRARALAVP
jgi:hypothetical protein